MINLAEEFNNFASVVCINGEIPAKDFFDKYSSLPLFSADGSANKLIQMGIKPSLIIGDLDSLNRDIIPSEIEILHIPDQNSTDLQKVLDVIEDKDLFPCMIYGVTGRETDHTLYNLAVIEQYSQKHKIIFHDSAYKDREKYGIYVQDFLYGKLSVGSKISILSSSNSMVTTKGLTWELNNFELSSKISSARNIVKSEEVEIKVHQGQVLVLFDL